MILPDPKNTNVEIQRTTRIGQYITKDMLAVFAIRDIYEGEELHVAHRTMGVPSDEKDGYYERYVQIKPNPRGDPRRRTDA
jgi:NADH:ubiquinone oxidoreductase subunit E